MVMILKRRARFGALGRCDAFFGSRVMDDGCHREVLRCIVCTVRAREGTETVPRRRCNTTFVLKESSLCATTMIAR